MPLTSEQRDRARGVLLGTALGDALGAPLEFDPRPALYPQQIGMTGGGAHRGSPGQWTDDTSMAVIIAQAMAAHGGLDDAALDDIALGFEEWSRTAPDVGMQTRTIMHATAAIGVTASNMTAQAERFAANATHADGNGSLMRTAPVVLAFLEDDIALADAAARVSALTHAAADSVDACVLWCHAMRAAIMDGGGVDAARAGLHVGLQHVDGARRDIWIERLAIAEASEPWDFPRNGWVVHAIQAAWSAITCTRDHENAPERAFVRGLDHAVRCGSDTDTVGAIAGALLGAIYGVGAMPGDWVDSVHGWPSLTGADLLLLCDRISQ